MDKFTTLGEIRRGFLSCLELFGRIVRRGGGRLECILTEDQLRERCAYWQQRMKLQDWDVSVEVLRARDFDRDRVEGYVQWTLSRKSAHIQIMDPVDYDPDTIAPYDMEHTLVHELGHLLFAPFDAESETLEQICQEQAIEAYTAALLTLERRTA